MIKIVKKLTQFKLSNDKYQLLGEDVVKVDWRWAQAQEQMGKLVLVTAITPTPFGEGKTTVTIGLTDALNALQKKTMAALREPSLGPVFGRKGGGTGGGATEILPTEAINLHFTGDFHAITSAHNLIAAMIDQNLFFDKLSIDTKRIVWKRAIDMNDRSLRRVTINIKDGVSYESGFQITASSEIMAILCLARNVNELKQMIDSIVFAYSLEGKPLTVAQLEITEAILALLDDAFSPNIVLTSGGSLAVVHGGPFANIAHGCNSILATKLALACAEYTITEAGFGSDLGAEKFLNIKAPKLGKIPDCLVLVVTVRALKYHGGSAITDVMADSNDALRHGLGNLQKHVENLQRNNIPLLITINAFAEDDPSEWEIIKNFTNKLGLICTLNKAFSEGGAGAIELAKAVLERTTTACTCSKGYKKLYEETETCAEKIAHIVKKIYCATEINYSNEASIILKCIMEKQLNYPICIAKTPEAFTQNSKDRGIPKEYCANITNIKVAYGAQLIIVFMGNTLDMPGLAKEPRAKHFKIPLKMQAYFTK